ncbi:MAG: hypothetical protein LVQ96_04365 [Thermoplasmatales archaeon]|nr:hypothetical protein [Thermoplasmatales archaeon]MCW6170388.1 hypothetical protein [Thermoplasmatales archaeon]
MKIDSILKEKKSLLLLDGFPWEEGCVVIGGYAVLGYGTLRYSRDLNLLIPIRLSKKINEWFIKQGFSIDKVAIPNPQNYDGRYTHYSKGELSVDLLIGAVRDREAQVDIPETWISKQPTMSKIIGFNGSTITEVPLVRLEALWALKMQAGRLQDISDMFSIFNRKFSHESVIEIFTELRCDSLKEKLLKTRGKLREKNTYPDVRSALHFRDSSKAREQWNSFTTTVDSMIDAILSG